MNRLWLLLLLPVLACASAGGKPRSGPAPAADELLRALEERHRTLRTLQMETLATSWLGGERVRGEVSMLVDRTGRLRFDTEVALQGTVAALSVSGGQFALIDFGKHEFHTGPACPENVAKVIPIPLMPDELAAILLGDAPLGQGTRAVDVEWDGKRGAEVLALQRPTAGASATRLWVGLRKRGTEWVPVSLEGVSPWSRERWRVSYEEHEQRGQVAVPTLVRFAEPGRSFDDGVDVKVRGQVDVNESIDEERLRLRPPEGWPVVKEPCNEMRP